ncbi:helix-turn-helix domain-containing protein [Delftia sp. PS-11]|uniref:helix-turn-helix domain-containing protein n=1 Tax=Delftia sp. PS-11 TaxID=2767222 RepID=UPI002455F43E|nr:helix-turn-helix domain-containing protein [Delftia sp. PS-11]KAJ8740959.1 helix-turn-helix domain-containing protein [Delftia sp. PS-11]
MQHPATALPSTTFTTSQVAGADRFDAWRSSVSVLFDATPVAPDAPLQDFQATVHAVHLGQLLLGDLHFGAQRFSRDDTRVAHDGLEHYLVQWYRSGGFTGRHGDDNELNVQAGDVVVFDMARTQHTVAQGSHVLSLIVPRKLGDAAFGSAGMAPHGTVLSGTSVFGGLLADHLDSVYRRLPSIGVEQADDVVHATLQMLAACLRPSMRTLAQAQGEMQAVTLERIQRHIALHLGTPLTPETLSQAFGISRYRLYQLFEPLGGVVRYVQQRRLQRAFQALSTPAYRRLRVADVAARLGFTSEAHFSRAFRATFGYTPSDVRAMSESAREGHHAAPVHITPASVEYADWLLGLMA